MSNRSLYDFQDRDVAILIKAESFTPKVHPDLIESGWDGGTVVKWVHDPHGDFMVGRCGPTDNPSGFLLWGSNEDADQFISMTEQQPKIGYAVMFFGDVVFRTRTYERYTQASRNGPGPLVELPYIVGEELYISENGKLTSEKEHPDAEAYGLLATAPTEKTKFYIGVQLDAV